MRKLLAVALLLASNLFAGEDRDRPPHTNGEILLDVGIGIASSAAGGAAAAGGHFAGAFASGAQGAKSFLDAASKYNENVRYHKEREQKSQESCD